MAWSGAAGTAGQRQVGIECLSPETNIWESRSFRARRRRAPASGNCDRPFGAAPASSPRQACPCGRWSIPEYASRRGRGGRRLLRLSRPGLGSGRIRSGGCRRQRRSLRRLLMANLHGSIHNRAGLAVEDLPGVLTALNGHLYATRSRTVMRRCSLAATTIIRAGWLMSTAATARAFWCAETAGWTGWRRRRPFSGCLQRGNAR